MLFGRDVFSFESLENRVMLSAAPAGLSPAQIRHAYGFDATVFSNNGTIYGATGRGQTIAIVDAYSDPSIAGDLRTFDSTYALPNTDINGNFVLTVATPEGTPIVDGGWAQEISLDVEWAHAVAPKADILLVEAASDSFPDLMNAVNYAKTQTGVVAVSMSWGGGEFRGEVNYDSVFTTPAGHTDNNGLAGGVTFVTASGDSGAGTSYPASSPNVIAVGGTTLNVDAAGNYLTETAWSGSGGGNSRIEQTSMPDVAYNADPNTGYAVYDSTSYQGESGWMVFGGTSAGTPQWAGLFADIAQGRNYIGSGSLDGQTQSIPGIYNLPSTDFHDITSGNNGFYSAGVGYDLVTGLGTPVVPRIVDDLVGNGITGAWYGSAATVVPVANIPRSATHFATLDQPVAAAISFAPVDAFVSQTVSFVDTPFASSGSILDDNAETLDVTVQSIFQFYCGPGWPGLHFRWATAEDSRRIAMHEAPVPDSPSRSGLAAAAFAGPSSSVPQTGSLPGNAIPNSVCATSPPAGAFARRGCSSARSL
jgi:subtilase family serine protease